jgi:hypothetical protein
VTRWGATRAAEVRPWVRAISLALKSSPEAIDALAATLKSSAPPFARLSALDASLRFPPRADLVPAIEPLLLDEDTTTRAIAFVALIYDDPTHAELWRDRALADRSAIVRASVLLRSPSARGVSEQALERALDDMLKTDIRPPNDLLQLAHLLERSGLAGWAHQVSAEAGALAGRVVH